MLEQTIRRYQNRTIEAIQVIEELIRLARAMREAKARGERLGLSEEELAFYDALETNDSAVRVLGDETLRTIARELVETVRNNVTIDWAIRENVRARLPRAGQARSPQAWLPARQAGEGDTDRPGADRGSVRRTGRLGRALKMLLQTQPESQPSRHIDTRLGSGADLEC